MSSAYVEASRCRTNSSSYFYFLDQKTPPRDLKEFCTIIAKNIPVMMKDITGLSALDIYQKLLMGIDLFWNDIGGNYLSYQGYYCWEEKPSRFQFIIETISYNLSYVHLVLVSVLKHGPLQAKILCDHHCLRITGGVVLVRTVPGILSLLALIMYKWRRRHLSVDDTIEEFLQSQNNFAPIRYSYREIKKMTEGFKYKLGEGGYGSVFKGKLRSGYHVAIKLLGKSKADGQDFINEVASIGRIHYVNVTKLVGFCVEGSKKALEYDFMPHNILLDENFTPKVSDFGLAKLYSVNDSIVSLTAARGTIGYIAPELVYKNIGGVSYKADVYSFGMLVMEIIGKRKEFNPFAEHTSETYFPTWIYDRLMDPGEDIVLGDNVTDDEKLMVRKMVVVAFWCIQMNPVDRPSMSKVLKMLESDVELLEMPPKPFCQLPLETSTEDHVSDNSIDDPTTSLLAVTIHE
ncbi:hypothetical protein PTKIN_Ptkin14bG0205200 [Pterospermum kingtungense]